MNYPELKVESIQYFPGDRGPQSTDAEISSLESKAMETALEYGQEALSNGNPPIGAVLIDNRNTRQWAGSTVDSSTKHLQDHAEQRVYNLAQPVVGDSLKNCTLVTTAQPCTDCTPVFASGKIGKIIYAAPRSHVYPLTGIMRPRRINMPDLLDDGNTLTTVIGNYEAVRSLALFAAYGELKRYKPKHELGSFLLNILENPKKLS